METVWLYVLNGLADWETGYLTAELNSGRIFADKSVRRPVRTVAASADPITTMGGLRITPDATVADLDPSTSAALVLPGATTWEAPGHQQVLKTARRFLDARVPVAAICGATQALAAVGMLDNRAHTSGAPQALEVPGYRGAARYVDAPAVNDRGLITAGPMHPVEFARETLAALDVIAPDTLEAWYQLNKTGDPRWYGPVFAAASAPA
jgi:putative intracellular protease/amidase